MSGIRGLICSVVLAFVAGSLPAFVTVPGPWGAWIGSSARAEVLVVDAFSSNGLFSAGVNSFIGTAGPTQGPFLAPRKIGLVAPFGVNGQVNAYPDGQRLQFQTISPKASDTVGFNFSYGSPSMPLSLNLTGSSSFEAVLGDFAAPDGANWSLRLSLLGAGPSFASTILFAPADTGSTTVTVPLAPFADAGVNLANVGGVIVRITGKGISSFSADQFAFIPEPASATLLGTAALTLAARRRQADRRRLS